MTLRCECEERRRKNRKAMVIKLLMDSKRLGDNYTTKLRWLSCLAIQKEKYYGQTMNSKYKIEMAELPG